MCEREYLETTQKRERVIRYEINDDEPKGRNDVAFYVSS